MGRTDTDENVINDTEENLEIITMIAVGENKEIKESWRKVYGCRKRYTTRIIGGPDSEP